MKITLTLPGGEVRPLTPWENGQRAVAPGPCPFCGAEEFPVAGKGTYIESHDTYAADAVALCCRTAAGTIRAQVSTIFGLEEDERVLNGRCRVY